MADNTAACPGTAFGRIEVFSQLPKRYVAAGSQRPSVGGRDALKDDDREDPVGVLLVFRSTVGDLGIEAVPLLPSRHYRLGLEGAVA